MKSEVKRSLSILIGENDSKLPTASESIAKAYAEIQMNSVMKSLFNTYEDSSNKSFDLKVAGKDLKLQLGGKLTAITIVRDNLIVRMKALEELIGEAPVESSDNCCSSDMEGIVITCPKYSWKQRDAMSDSVSESVVTMPVNTNKMNEGKSSKKRDMANDYNNYAYAVDRYNVDIAYANCILRNVDDNKKYDISLSKAVKLGL